MASDTQPEARESSPERALILLAGALILAASSRVAVPLTIFAVVVLALALPMSGLIAWLSRFDPQPDVEDEDDADLPPLTVLHADPLPRPVRPRGDA